MLRFNRFHIKNVSEQSITVTGTDVIGSCWALRAANPSTYGVRTQSLYAYLYNELHPGGKLEPRFAKIRLVPPLEAKKSQGIANLQLALTSAKSDLMHLSDEWCEVDDLRVYIGQIRAKIKLVADITEAIVSEHGTYRMKKLHEPRLMVESNW